MARTKKVDVEKSEQILDMFADLSSVQQDQLLCTLRWLQKQTAKRERLERNGDAPETVPAAEGVES